jgi:hypothetical protein
MAAVIFIFAACTGTWTPDSKSFVYSSGGNAIMLRDFANKRSKKLVSLAAPPKGSIFQIGVRDDGKQLAVLRVHGTKENPFVRFRVFDIAGKPLHTSPDIKLKTEVKLNNEFSRFEFCYWAGTKYLIGIVPQLSCMISYEIEKKEHHIFDGMIPLSMLMHEMAPWSSVTPASPDGSKFIAYKENEIQIVPLPKGEPRAVEIPKSSEKVAIDARAGPGSVRLRGYWEKHTLVFPVNSVELRIDCKNESVSIRETERLKRLFEHAKEAKSLLVGQLSKDWVVEAIKEPGAQGTDSATLRIHNIKTKQDKPIPKVDQVMHIAVTPAPDRKHFLVFAFSQSPTFLVLDTEGNVVDRVDNFLGQLPNPQ